MADTATTLPPAHRAPRFDLRTILTRHGAWIALALLILVNLAITPNFATWQTLNVNLTQVCAIVIVGVGMTLVIGSRVEHPNGSNRRIFETLEGS